jgi:hypothetical protein
MTEEIHRRGPWKGLEDVEFAALEWVAWYNGSRLLEPLGYVPPAESGHSSRHGGSHVMTSQGNPVRFRRVEANGLGNPVPSSESPLRPLAEAGRASVLRYEVRDRARDAGYGVNIAHRRRLVILRKSREVRPGFCGPADEIDRSTTCAPGGVLARDTFNYVDEDWLKDFDYGNTLIEMSSHTVCTSRTTTR